MSKKIVFCTFLNESYRRFFFLVHSAFRHTTSETRVVVTGLGAVCPLGVGVSKIWNNLQLGKIGVESLTDPEYDSIPCKVAAFVPSDDENKRLNLKNIFNSTELKTISLATAYALIAAKEAISDANWFPKDDIEQTATGVAVGTGMVDLVDIFNTGNLLFSKGYNKISPFFVPRILSNMTAGHIAIKYGLKGPNHSVSTACATGLHAIGDAYNFIKNKQATVMVCGSGEAIISPISVAAFSRMRALATNFNSCPKEASRPFDEKRDGFVMGEGAAILVLESLSHALSRKAKIYAEVLGYGLSGDAYHITSPCVNGNGAFRCMKQALAQSNIEKSNVGYINAHATSTPLGDAIEIKAIYDLFGEQCNLVVSSTKGAIGHLLGAAGSIEAIFTVMSCFSKQIPPNINLDSSDIDCPVKLVGKKSQLWPEKLMTQRLGLTNSFGFGGTNASILFSNYIDEQ